MEEDSNQMREVDRMEMEDIQDSERIRNLELEEVVRNHVGVDHNNLEGVAALLEEEVDEAHQVVLVVAHRVVLVVVHRVVLVVAHGLEIVAEFLEDLLEVEHRQGDADVKEVHRVEEADGVRALLDWEECALGAVQDLLVLADAGQKVVDGVQLVEHSPWEETSQVAVRPAQHYGVTGQYLEDLVQQRNELN